MIILEGRGWGRPAIPALRRLIDTGRGQPELHSQALSARNQNNEAEARTDEIRLIHKVSESCHSQSHGWN